MKKRLVTISINLYAREGWVMTNEGLASVLTNLAENITEFGLMENAYLKDSENMEVGRMQIFEVSGDGEVGEKNL